jgi:hypothetical protein
VKYVDLIVDSEELVQVIVQFGPADVTEAMGLPPDAKPEVVDAYTDPRVAPYVQQWFSFEGCEIGTPTAQRSDRTVVKVLYAARCKMPRDLRLDFTRFFELDAKHEAIVRLSAPGSGPITTIVRASEPRVTLRAGEGPSLLAWVKTGMHHIYSGIDHILFVISLLLVVMLYPGMSRGEWHTRAFGMTLRSTALIITSFTIAHSITLIAAALGFVELPSHIVEAVIALSIAYTAAEDVVKPDVRWRFALTFAFGLIHGVGFASTLAGLLPPTDVVVPLLCFNLGVEIGQLTIVLVVLPVLWLVARKIGASRYRRYGLPVVAAPIFVAGVAMVIDRVT